MMHNRFIARSRLLTIACLAASFGQASQTVGQSARAEGPPHIIVLGLAQDGGYPQAGCQKACCKSAWFDPTKRRFVASLAIIDPDSGQRWFIDCTPDFPSQLAMLDRATVASTSRSAGSASHDPSPARSTAAGQTSTNTAPQHRVVAKSVISGILLTHAHIGHYTGLVHLGREVMGRSDIPVYAMPRMKHFLETNGPWSQLVTLRNIELRSLVPGEPVRLNERIRIRPILVPHRQEYSETVGFQITGPRRSVVYIPDIDKWDRWEKSVEAFITSSDAAYLDGTFFNASELPGRDMTQIPHPFVVESMKRFSSMPLRERRKIRFIHLNHTNPALNPTSDAVRAIQKAGLNVAQQGERFDL